MCSLKPYQSQALYWMTKIEKGGDDENAERNLHPCWSAYNICNGLVQIVDGSTSKFKLLPCYYSNKLAILFNRRSIYVNIFTGEAAKKFPQATQMARGGVSLFKAVEF